MATISGCWLLFPDFYIKIFRIAGLSLMAIITGRSVYYMRSLLYVCAAYGLIKHSFSSGHVETLFAKNFGIILRAKKREEAAKKIFCILSQRHSSSAAVIPLSLPT